VAVARQKVGVVVSNKMEKTAVVAVERRYPHPLYRKIVRRTKRYKVHDPENSSNLGDIVRIVETRPISKEKRWRIAEVITRGNVAELRPTEVGESEVAEVALRPAQPEAAEETAPAAVAVAEPEAAAEPEVTASAEPPAAASEESAEAEETGEADDSAEEAEKE
jgi:small subunit ribosomal protein S17